MSVGVSTSSKSSLLVEQAAIYEKAICHFLLTAENSLFQSSPAQSLQALHLFRKIFKQILIQFDNISSQSAESSRLADHPEFPQILARLISTGLLSPVASLEPKPITIGIECGDLLGLSCFEQTANQISLHLCQENSFPLANLLEETFALSKANKYLKYQESLLFCIQLQLISSESLHLTTLEVVLQCIQAWFEEKQWAQDGLQHYMKEKGIQNEMSTTQTSLHLPPKQT